MFQTLKVAAFWVLLAITTPAAAFLGLESGPAKLTPAQLQEDFAVIRKTIDATHPDPGFSADPVALSKAYAAVEKKIKKPLTRDEAWRVFASLNPVFSDAHLLVAMGDMESEAKAHVASGGGFFPYEVYVDAAGDVFIQAELGGAASELARAKIEKINGVPAHHIVRKLLGLTFGDTPALRANLLGPRWWSFYWKSFGAPAVYDLQLSTAQGSKRIRRTAAARMPSTYAKDDDFDQNYRFEMLSEKVALLTVGSFIWPDKKLFYAFTEKAFTQLRDAGATTLIIDVRTNTGGDDDMWKEGILRYTASKPYRHGSTAIKKVIEGRQSATEKVGDIVNLEVQTWEQPQLDNPLHFKGKMYVLTGRTTYSSSVLFANTMQDFQFATLVGEAGTARVRQSGGIQQKVLPHSKWAVIAPRFILDRPSGARQPALVQPDLILADDPFDSRALINTLHARIVANQ